jgi:paraquat-inducible protein B
VTDVPEARITRRRFAPIWLVPLAAAGIAVWLGLRTINDRGAAITITFESAEGLEAGRTRVMLRNVDVGMVETLDLGRDLLHVVVHARVRRDLEPHLTTGTRFWVVRARFGAGGVSGLGTLVSGSFIEMEPGQGKPTLHFQGLEEPPVAAPAGEGKTITLHAASLGSLMRGSPVNYRGVTVGEMLGASLSKDARSVAISVFIRGPHDALVHPETRFWNASGFEISAGGQGFKVRAESLQAIIAGGIAFDTRPESEDAPPSPNGAEFKLYRDEDAAHSDPYGPLVSYLLYFGGSVRGLDIGSPVEFLGIRVGKVSDVRLEGRDGVVRVPVVITLEPERSLLHEGALPPGPTELQARTDAEFSTLVQHGLRGELKTVSMLTGQRVVALKFMPNAPSAKLKMGGRYPELPTTPGSDLDGLTTSAAQLLAEAQRLVSGANAIVRSPELAATVKNLETLTRDASQHVGPTLQSLQAASAQLDRTLAATSGMLGSSATGSGELPKAVRDLREAARSVRLLTDYLERHPEAVLRGKQEGH